MKRIPLKMQLLAAEQELNDFNSLFDLQRKRSIEANKLWQKDTGEKCNPDLGELLRYFMAQRELLDRFYWMLREGKYGSDEYADVMESYERKDFCRSNMIDDMGKGVERGRTHGRGLRRDGVAKPREKGTSSGFLSKN